MGVFIGLPVDRVWDAGSDLQAIGRTPNFGSFQAAKMTPFWDPNFPLPCGQLLAPFLYAHREPGPKSKLCTQIEVLGPAS